MDLSGNFVNKDFYKMEKNTKKHSLFYHLSLPLVVLLGRF